MTYLNLSNNQIEEIPASFKNLKSLETLDLRNNKLTKLPVEITKLKPKTVLVAGNYLNNIDENLIKWLDLYAEDEWNNLQN